MPAIPAMVAGAGIGNLIKLKTSPTAIPVTKLFMTTSIAFIVAFQDSKARRFFNKKA